MIWAHQFLLDQFLVFTLVLSRVSGLVMTAPIFGTTDVPMPVRALLAVALSALVMPLVWGQSLVPPGNLVNYLVIVGAEVLVGFTLGMAINILFSGIQVAANVIGQMSGLQMAEVYDPTSDTTGPVFAQIMSYVTLAVFVLIGGHRKLLGALLDTFVWLPPGMGSLPSGLADAATSLVAQSFILAVRAAAPTMTALLLAHLVLGLIGRTMPQLNINALGFGFNSLVGMGMLALSLGAMVWMFQEQIDLLLENVLDVFHQAAKRVPG
jgi:flagellar biosynthetic protein FliR